MRRDHQCKAPASARDTAARAARWERRDGGRAPAVAAPIWSAPRYTMLVPFISGSPPGVDPADFTLQVQRKHQLIISEMK